MTKSYRRVFSLEQVFCSNWRQNVTLKSVGIKSDTVFQVGRSDHRRVSSPVQIPSWRHRNARRQVHNSTYTFPLRAIPICPSKLQNRVKSDNKLVLSDERLNRKKPARSFSTINILWVAPWFWMVARTMLARNLAKQHKCFLMFWI